MAVKRRTIWMDDLQWTKAQQRAEGLGLNVSQYFGKLVEWRQPASVHDAIVEHVRTALPDMPVYSGRPFTPVPKPSKRK